jgi:hypothetical protein
MTRIMPSLYNNIISRSSLDTNDAHNKTPPMRPDSKKGSSEWRLQQGNIAQASVLPV